MPVLFLQQVSLFITIRPLLTFCAVDCTLPVLLNFANTVNDTCSKTQSNIECMIQRTLYFLLQHDAGTFIGVSFSVHGFFWHW